VPAVPDDAEQLTHGAGICSGGGAALPTGASGILAGVAPAGHGQPHREHPLGLGRAARLGPR
jgi:hypothetical protein